MEIHVKENKCFLFYLSVMTIGLQKLFVTGRWIHETEVLSVQDVKKVYRVRKTKGNKQTKLNALDGISFCLNEGEALGIIGASGCGKSTLLKIILGLVKPTSGHITKKGIGRICCTRPI